MLSLNEAGVVTLLFLMGCSPAAGPTARPSASTEPTRGVATASAAVPTAHRSASTEPTQDPAAASPAARPSLLPTHELAWDPLETTGLELNSITAALSFAGAYLVIGTDEDDLYHVARSTDGRAWAMTPIGATVSAAASDGVRVVLVGKTQQAVAWVSTDGLSWQGSTGFGAVDGSGLERDVWPIPGGWEVLVDGIEGPSSIWRSADGLDWKEVGVVAPADWSDLSVTIGASASGTRLLSLFNSPWSSGATIGGLRAGESRIQSSVDGVHWTSVGLVLPTGRGVEAGGIVAPGPAGPPMWLLVVNSEEDERTLTYTSTDLQRWERGTFPRHDILGLRITRYGFIATGRTNCPPGSDCRPDPTQYLSTDGLQWTPFASSVPSLGQDGGDIKWVEIVDGPAGVLAFSIRGFEVWRLRP